jgi:hypothetical protein
LNRQAVKLGWDSVRKFQMPKMAELYSLPDEKMLMVGKLAIIVEHFERLSPGVRRKRFIMFDGKRYRGKAVETLKGK